MASARTTVPRCTCQKRWASSCGSSSFSGVRSRCSPLAVTTRTYLSAAWKNSTSATGTIRITLPPAPAG
jgi:hypothetical protein